MHTRERDKIIHKDSREEYSTEFTPNLKGYSFDKKLYTDTSAAAKIIGYMGLFFSLFSIVFFPVFLGTIGVVIGIFTVINNQKTLGYTTIGFGLFAILFTFLTVL